jgi:hypothetical protein
VYSTQVFKQIYAEHIAFCIVVNISVHRANGPSVAAHLKNAPKAASSPVGLRTRNRAAPKSTGKRMYSMCKRTMWWTWLITQSNLDLILLSPTSLGASRSDSQPPQSNEPILIARRTALTSDAEDIFRPPLGLRRKRSFNGSSDEDQDADGLARRRRKQVTCAERRRLE